MTGKGVNDSMYVLSPLHSIHWLSALSFNFAELISHEAIVTRVRYSSYIHTINF